jgi:putative restriction endonuclease
MKKGQKLWAREELILAINLYCKLPFGRLHKSNPEVIELSELIGRTSSSVAYKLVNFASLDPSLQARGIKGAANTSKLDRKIWNEFFSNFDDLAYESVKLFANLKQTSLELIIDIHENRFFREGKTKEQLVKVRVNQSFFRKTILASYNDTCCITGIKGKDFLIAGHIKPWGMDSINRLNPRNGIAINALHDKAFEAGYLTITTDYKIKISPSLLMQKHDSINDYFSKYENKDIILPSRFLPDVEFLEYHNQERFKS